MAVDDVATRLGVSVRFVRRLVAERRIPYVKVGKFVRFDPSEIEVWIDERRSAIPDGLPSEGHRRYAMDMSGAGEKVAGALLRSTRVRLGLSQTAFAGLIGVAQPTLSAYESGRRQPTLPTLLGMLEQAGYDLRLEVVERDVHDAVLGEWERSLDESTRERLRR